MCNSAAEVSSPLSSCQSAAGGVATGSLGRGAGGRDQGRRGGRGQGSHSNERAGTNNSQRKAAVHRACPPKALSASRRHRGGNSPGVGSNSRLSLIWGNFSAAVCVTLVFSSLGI